jgi:hypothetical protein
MLTPSGTISDPTTLTLACRHVRYRLFSRWECRAKSSPTAPFAVERWERTGGGRPYNGWSEDAMRLGSTEKPPLETVTAMKPAMRLGIRCY